MLPHMGLFLTPRIGELLEKLAALVPPPRLNLVRYHGVLAPNAADARCAGQHARRRNACVRSGRGAVRKTGTPRLILGINQPDLPTAQPKQVQPWPQQARIFPCAHYP